MINADSVEVTSESKIRGVDHSRAATGVDDAPEQLLRGWKLIPLFLRLEPVLVIGGLTTVVWRLTVI